MFPVEFWGSVAHLYNNSQMATNCTWIMPAAASQKSFRPSPRPSAWVTLSGLHSHFRAQTCWKCNDLTVKITTLHRASNSSSYCSSYVKSPTPSLSLSYLFLSIHTYILCPYYAILTNHTTSKVQIIHPSHGFLPETPGVVKSHGFLQASLL